MILIMNPLRTESGLIDEAAVRKSFSLIKERENPDMLCLTTKWHFIYYLSAEAL